MTAEELFAAIRAKRSFLCIGLDTDYKKIPKALLEKDYPIFEFNKHIIDATEDLAVAYKPNIAFYESMGVAGWMSLEMTVGYIRKNFPEIFIIADAKRGDIGNTSSMYAHAFFDNLDFDAITLSPYMGHDSIMPYLKYPNRGGIVLARTSNDGAEDFQNLVTESGKPVFEEVIEKVASWGTADNLMFVAGATRPDSLRRIRQLVPDHFILVPGIGAQGGQLKSVVEEGMNDRCGLLVNVSRSVLYADITNRFEIAARKKATALRDEMEEYLVAKKLI